MLSGFELYSRWVPLTVLVSSCKYELVVVVVVVVVGAKAKSFLSDARQPEKCPFLSLNFCFLLIK